MHVQVGLFHDNALFHLPILLGLLPRLVHVL